MSDNTHYSPPGDLSSKGSVAEQIVNGERPELLSGFTCDPTRHTDSVAGTHPAIQDTKTDFQGLAGSSKAYGNHGDAHQPMSHFHSLFYDLFTWKSPKTTGFFFLSTISMIFLFHYINALRYVFKAAYMLFASAALVEGAGKLFGAQGVISSIRPRRYYTIPRESLEHFFEQLHELANFFILEFQRVLFVENIFATVAAFIASFFGYFLIKYIPFWTLLLLTTVTAFTAPLIYINNKELIDEQIRNVSEIISAQFENAKKIAGKYAGDAASYARTTAAGLQTKVSGYAHGMKSSSKAKTAVPSTAAAPSKNGVAHEYPKAPTNEPVVSKPAVDGPLLA